MSFNRSKYFDYISERLHTLAIATESSGKLNVLNLHNHAEVFYLFFFKELYGWDLKNSNATKQNQEALDLVSGPKDKIVIQVSATCTKRKIEDALSKDIIKKHKDYRFKFISISKDASALKKETYSNPHSIVFSPCDDIYDINSILNEVLYLNIDAQKRIRDFIKKELGHEVDMEKLDSNLASVINLLAKENLDEGGMLITTDSFEIERKISFNDLETVKEVISDYSVYHSRLDKIYSEFDSLGVNKSNSVLSAIRSEYLRNSKVSQDDELFYLIIDNIKDIIRQSANFTELPAEELELCVNILVVDAFIRCKIFRNPNDYKYAIAR